MGKIDTIKHLAETNTWEYNHLKAAEELMELAEVLLKKVNKKGGIKEPLDQAIIDEIGDVEIRLDVLGRIYSAAAINDRYYGKLAKFDGFIEEGKYIGKI